jgi:hypothetical protein
MAGIFPGKHPGNVRETSGFVRGLSGFCPGNRPANLEDRHFPDKYWTNPGQSPDNPRRNSAIALNPSRKFSRMKSRTTRGKILHESGPFPASFPFQPFSFSFFVQVLLILTGAKRANQE